MGCKSAQSEWKELFDGKSLSGWDGDPKFWSVKDGVIQGKTTKRLERKLQKVILLLFIQEKIKIGLL